MYLNPMDLGVCGVLQYMHAGKVTFDTEGAGDGVVLVELPENIIIKEVTAVVNTPFNAATTNTVTIGMGDAYDDLLASEDLTAGTAGEYTKSLFRVCKGELVKINAKYEQTGSAATAGDLDIYLGVIRIPA